MTTTLMIPMESATSTVTGNMNDTTFATITSIATSINAVSTDASTVTVTGTSIYTFVSNFSGVTTGSTATNNRSSPIATFTSVNTAPTDSVTNTLVIITTSDIITNSLSTTITSLNSKFTTSVSNSSSTTTTNLNSTVNTSASIPNSSTDDSDGSGVIIAVVVLVLLLIAIVVTIFVIMYFWRRNHKRYNSFAENCENSKELPLSVTGPSISDYDYTKTPATNDDQRLSKNLELQNRSPDYQAQCPAEMSQKQTLSVINPEYERTKEKNNRSSITESTIANESNGNSIFTESITSTTFMSDEVCDSKDNDGLAPSSIYADPIPLVKSKGPPVVTMDNIKQVRELGTGLFGQVILADTVGLSYQYLGIGSSNDTSISMKVAVKILKTPATAEVKKAFDKEIRFMSRLKDDNVIRLLGICTTGTSFIMMEYMENGDLNDYLQKLNFTNDTTKVPAANEITLNGLVYISYQIASGMKYLSSCKYIHRDLAARNILVGINQIVKIADFGMSQNLYSAYYCRVGGRSVLPIRWMAHECFFGKFSVKTDVWAFGITLWEIFTLCRFLPYNDLTNQQMVEDAVRKGNRLIPSQPENCPDDIYCIIKSCLHHDPSQRAEFSVLCDQLNDYYTNIL